MKSIFKKFFNICLCSVIAIGGVLSFYAREPFVVNAEGNDYTYTNEYVVKDGKSDYQIVIEKDAAENIIFAAEELKLFFEESTGIELPIVYDDTVEYSATAKFISLGQNAVFEAAGLSTEGLDLDYEGYMIRTVENSVFIAGDRSRGTLYGTYEYLERDFGFDCFSNTLYYIDKGVTELKLKQFNITEKPDCKLRANSHMFISEDKYASNRMRLNSKGDENFVGHKSAHSGFLYVPPADYYNAEKMETYHPKWYASSGTQLCYTAHGDAVEYEALVNEVFIKMRDFLIENTEGFILTWGQEDQFGYCNCEACASYTQKYGCVTAVMINFCNDLTDKIELWMETDEGSPYARDFRLMLLAYYNSIVPPAKYNTSTSQWEPIDNSSYAVCDERVVPWFAPIKMNFYQSLKSEANKDTYGQWLGWLACSEEMAYFLYDNNYAYSLVWCDTFNSQFEMYQMIAQENTLYTTECGERQTGAEVAFQIYKIYLESKLAWDGDADVQALTEKFFDNYYGSAADTMYNLYLDYRAQSKYVIDNELESVSYYIDLLETNYWPKSFLDRCLNHIEQAFADIAHFKYVDPTLYQTYYDNICLERITIYYLMVELYDGQYSNTRIEEMKQTVKYDCNRLGVSMVSEASSIDVLFESWGV